MLPKNIIFIRHGTSESNVAFGKSLQGDESLFTDDFYNRDDTDFRLTKSGVEQAKKTNEFIKKTFSNIKFNKFFVSCFIRAIETASYLTCLNANWKVHWELAERDWGKVTFYTIKGREEKFKRSFLTKQNNPFEWKPENGENMRDVVLRAQNFLKYLKKEGDENNDNVVIVCHEEMMRAFRFVLEKMIPSDYMELENPKHHEKLHNCSILHYSRINPETNEEDSEIKWFRILSPLKEENAIGDWNTIQEQLYSCDDLRKMCERIQPIFPHCNL